jgi:hypothetical protein
MTFLVSALLVGVAWSMGYCMGHHDGRRGEEATPAGPVRISGTVILPDAVGVPARHRRKAALVLAGVR